jgi:thioredoxin reductase (NADPH)
MQNKAMANPKIDFMWNAVVTDVLGDAENGVQALKVKSTTDNSVKDVPFDGLFLAIGHKPNTEFLGGQLTLDDSGYVITHDGTNTSKEGVFACGDVQDHIYRQAITAAGSGCMAALDAERYLEAKGQ